MKKNHSKIIKLSFWIYCFHLCSLKEIGNKSIFVIVTPFFYVQVYLATIINSNFFQCFVLQSPIFSIFCHIRPHNSISYSLVYTCNRRFQPCPHKNNAKVRIYFSSMNTYSHSSIHSNKIPSTKREFKGNFRYAFN